VLDGEDAQSDLSDSAHTRQQLTHICAEARGLLATMDEILWAVNPRRDTLRDFTAYVCKYAQHFLRPTKIQCILEVEPVLATTVFSLPLRRSLFMAIKESLNNAVKYSEATELRLKIQWLNQRLVVEVSDNGKGFDPATVTPDRNGLSNMAQRMTEVGGNCLVQSHPGEGCKVEFSMPLNQRRPWTWIWNGEQLSEGSNHTNNIQKNKFSQTHDPTKF
jgi:signal transduction histidine kinase